MFILGKKAEKILVLFSIWNILSHQWLNLLIFLILVPLKLSIFCMQYHETAKSLLQSVKIQEIFYHLDFDNEKF